MDFSHSRPQTPVSFREKGGKREGGEIDRQTDRNRDRDRDRDRRDRQTDRHRLNKYVLRKTRKANNAALRLPFSIIPQTTNNKQTQQQFYITSSFAKSCSTSLSTFATHSCANSSPPPFSLCAFCRWCLMKSTTSSVCTGSDCVN